MNERVKRYQKLRRKIFLRIKRVNSMLVWIVSSDRGAYAPYTKTIYLRKDTGVSTMIHELTHWFIHTFLFNSKKLHNILDKWKKET